MELFCPALVAAVPRLLDGSVPVVATVALKRQGLGRKNELRPLFLFKEKGPRPLLFSRHHAIGEDPQRQALLGFGQDALEGFIVAILLEQRQPRIGAVENMVDIASFGGTQRSAHARRLTRKSEDVKKKVPDTFSWV